MVTWDAFAQTDYNAFGPNLETRIRGKFSEKNITQRNERTEKNHKWQALSVLISLT